MSKECSHRVQGKERTSEGGSGGGAIGNDGEAASTEGVHRTMTSSASSTGNKGGTEVSGRMVVEGTGEVGPGARPGGNGTVASATAGDKEEAEEKCSRGSAQQDCK